MSEITGLHHVTAIAADAQENLDFYTGVLGMRLVKKSVNQDAPGTYHLFYADAEGNPGTDLTFFPWPEMPAARAGTGLTTEVALAVPTGSLAFWSERLTRHGVAAGAVEWRRGGRVLTLTDPHGLPLALAETGDPREFAPWARSPVPAERQVMGLHGVRLWERELAPTARLLTEVLGFTAFGAEAGWHRFGVGRGASGEYVEIREMPQTARGAWGTGGIHHVAWRVPDVAAEMAVQDRLATARRRPTEVIDRFWFQSVYFLEPGGVLFELATDGPGFTADEEPAALGERLVLPPWLEEHREEIESGLPPLRAAAESGRGAAGGGSAGRR
ncbi:MAG TPA: ring-cleaving dioxygenase [Gemmatimonadaceae bacterium]|nr:ring-cleaving dioxygenase [Gemmatimonadaceae bacterium]